MRILAVEDEPRMSALLHKGLSEHGHDVALAMTGAEALKLTLDHAFDVVLLDIALPELNGYDVAQVLRGRNYPAAILMLTAYSKEDEIVRGLNLGADDYLTKPFSPRELLLRIKKILARGVTVERPKEQMRFGDLVIDLPRHLASWKGKPIELTATEFKLLCTLAQRAGRVQSRDQLLRDVWEYDSLIDTRTVDTHMRRLREKLGAASKHLDTVRGVGYRFVE
jgi:DNA-binding response OmpR family regulator